MTNRCAVRVWLGLCCLMLAGCEARARTLEESASLAGDTRFQGPGKTMVMVAGKPVPLQVFPADNPWNRDISKLPVHRNSEQWISNIGGGTSLHPDYGEKDGIPFVVVRADEKRVKVPFDYAHESDPGPYPIPANPPIEAGGGDSHILMIDLAQRKLYELFAAKRDSAGRWRAGSGAIFDLTSNKLRPDGWTSADAAGLPIFAGLVRWEEVHQQGVINHALRFTAEKTQRGYVRPATHCASEIMTDLRPPMGMRVRLKADFDVRPYPPPVQVILRALKKYGMILADNGGDWFITGAPHPNWTSLEIESLKRVKGRFFEVVDTGDKVTVMPR